MTRVALRGLLGRKLRASLTALAIVLGVATISGTFVLTDSIDQAFERIFTGVRRDTDAAITATTAFDLSATGGAAAPTFDESLLERVRALAAVAEAEGSVDSDPTQLVDEDGNAVLYGAAPNIGFSIANPDSRFNPLTLVAGTWPGAGDVVIDEETAADEDFEVGETIGVQAEGPVDFLRVSGIVRFSSGLTIGGATLAGFDLRTAQRMFDKEGRLDEIAVAAEPDVTDAELIRQIRRILPVGTRVRSVGEQVERDSEGTNEFIGLLRGFLLAFGGISLVVGALVIANSLSITVAQRTRELATLRTLGASRRQVLTSILVEGVVLGVVASIVGLFLGLLLARALFRLFDAAGFTLPNTGLVLGVRTAVVAILAGVLVTLIASLRPAVRATRVPPIAAVREGSTLPPGRMARVRGPGAALATVAGLAALVYGLLAAGSDTLQALVWMGLGALLVFFATALVSSRLVPPLADVFAWPATLGGGSAFLARDNARRNPQRTASTAAALMIGLALVTLVATLAAGVVTSFKDAVDDLFTGDFAITAQNNFTPLPVDAAEAVARARGVVAVGSVRTGQTLVFGDRRVSTAVDPGIGEVISLDWEQGSQAVFASLGDDGAFVDAALAEGHALEPGSLVELTFPSGRTRAFVVRGVFDPPDGGSPFGAVTISSAAWDAETPQPRNSYSFVKMEDGPTRASRAELRDALAGFPNAKVQTREQFVDNMISGLTAVLNILYVLLALSIVVSLFGIANTLVLAVYERTREIGMLRAIGMTRGQVRGMIVSESVIVSLIGAAFGISFGTVLAALLSWRIDFVVFAFPATQIGVFVVAAILVGLVASIFPAQRAARLDPLTAIAYE